MSIHKDSKRGSLGLANGVHVETETGLRKRVPKACDRCRLKKIKCDGHTPCSRCKVDNTVCHFGHRRKGVERRVTTEYVEYLEEEQKVLVHALKKCWLQHGPAQGASHHLTNPSVHAILENLELLPASPVDSSSGKTASVDGEPSQWSSSSMEVDASVSSMWQDDSPTSSTLQPSDLFDVDDAMLDPLPHNSGELPMIDDSQSLPTSWPFSGTIQDIGLLSKTDHLEEPLGSMPFMDDLHRMQQDSQVMS